MQQDDMSKTTTVWFSYMGSIQKFEATIITDGAISDGTTTYFGAWAVEGYSYFLTREEAVLASIKKAKEKIDSLTIELNKIIEFREVLIEEVKDASS